MWNANTLLEEIVSRHCAEWGNLERIRVLKYVVTRVSFNHLDCLRFILFSCSELC